MIFESRLVRVWVIISIFSMFLYSLVQLINSVIGTGYTLGFGAVMAVFGLGPSVYADRPLFLFGHFFPELGLIVRFIGLTVALVSVCLLFAFKKHWLRIKRTLALAIFLESLFLLGFLATIPMLLDGINKIFAASYVVQVLFAAPPLIVLSWNIRKGGHASNGSSWKFAGLAFAGYMAAIFVNNIFRVFTANIMDVPFLVEQTSLGIFNAVVLVPLALGFAVTGLFTLFKRRNSMLAARLFAHSLVFLGSYFLIYIFYSSIIDALSSVMLVEIWATPLLGLGLSILYTTSKANKTENPNNPA